jgi:DNA-binding transcriptional regulator Cro
MLIMRPMRKADVIAHFGSVAAVTVALGCTRSAVHQWREIVPYASAKRLAEISPLVIDESLYDEHLKPVRHLQQIA